MTVMKQDHLVCFLGGSFLLGITEGGKKHTNWRNLDDDDALDYIAGTGIIDSCIETYQTATLVSFPFLPEPHVNANAWIST